MSDDQSGLLHLLYDLGDGVSLARARGTQEHLGLLAVLDAGSQIRNGLGLVTHGLERGCYLEGLLFRKLHGIKFRHHGHDSTLLH